MKTHKNSPGSFMTRAWLGGWLLATMVGCGHVNVEEVTGLWKESKELASGSVVVYYTQINPDGHGSRFGYVFPNIVDVDLSGQRQYRFVGPHLFERTEFAWELSDGKLRLYDQVDQTDQRYQLHEYHVNATRTDQLKVAQNGDRQARQWERLNVPLATVIEMDKSS